MDDLCKESVALDTNVFVHLLNADVNTGGHINALLSRLLQSGRKLLVDDEGFVAHEYREVVTPKMKESFEKLNELQLLRYWMSPEVREAHPLPRTNSELWKGVTRIIHEPRERTDCRFVCIAFLRGEPLVTNDGEHILYGPEKEHRNQASEMRRKRLLRVAKDLRHKRAAIHTTREAFELSEAKVPETSTGSEEANPPDHQ